MGTHFLMQVHRLVPDYHPYIHQVVVQQPFKLCLTFLKFSHQAWLSILSIFK
jgi:hypothetical protein